MHHKKYTTYNFEGHNVPSIYFIRPYWLKTYNESLHIHLSSFSLSHVDWAVICANFEEVDFTHVTTHQSILRRTTSLKHLVR